MSADGSLYVADQTFDRVRRVGPDGVIRAFAGVFSPDFNTSGGFSGDHGPAILAKFNEPRRVKCAPDGSVYIADSVNNRVRRVKSPLPGYADVADIVIGGSNGSEFYVFDPDGKHQRTVDALTGAVLYDFHYSDTTGKLDRITDRDGQITEIAEDGTTVTITGPFGQVTSLALNGDGYASAIAGPAGTTAFSTTSDGLITSVTDANDHTRTFTYESDGRLRLAQDPPGANGSDRLVRTELTVTNGSGYQVTHTTGEAVQTTYRVEQLAAGEQRRTTLNPDGTQTQLTIGVDGGRTNTAADGTVQTSAIGPDPRFGLQAPITTNATVTTPDGTAATVTGARSVSSYAGNPLVFGSQTDTTTINSRPPSTSTYDSATRVTTDTSPAGRSTQTAVDAKGRVTRVQATGLHPLRLGYDDEGRPTTMKYGPENPDTLATRTSSIAYVGLLDTVDFPDQYPSAAKGQVKSTTDAAGRTTIFEYDPQGRVSAQLLPDTPPLVRRVEFHYDPAGNVTSITPPGRPAHGFGYTPVNLEARYTPPQVTPPLAAVETTYAYTRDRQLDLVARPDGGTIDYAYDDAGRLDALTLDPPDAPPEVHDYVYDDPGGAGDETGTLAQIVTPEATLEFSYDGSLPTGEAWSGAGLATASVTQHYDASFRRDRQQIAVGAAAQPAISFSYDNDDLLTGVSHETSGGVIEALTLTPDPANGLLRGTSITSGAGTITDSIDYTDFGEVEHYTAAYNTAPFFSRNYARDALGRITRVTETLTLPPDAPQTTTTHYAYDDAGRLFRVCADAACCADPACTTAQAEYHYDTNGNRAVGTRTAQGTVTEATYDAQDRLLSMTVSPGVPTTYKYTANGELRTKTEHHLSGDQTTTYTYDALGNLRHVSLPTQPPTEIDYVIDGRNRRIGKKVDGVLVTQWLYENQLEPVAELDSAGHVTAEFVYGTGASVPDYLLRSGEAYRIVSDHLGSARLIVKVADGSIVQRTEYNEFGITLFQEEYDSSGNPIPLNPNAPFQPFGYGGGIADPHTRLVHLGARDYDPLGRWVSTDPIRFAGRSFNLYEYVHNDSINLSDPSGYAENVISLDAAIGIRISLNLKALRPALLFPLLFLEGDHEAGRSESCREEWRRAFETCANEILAGNRNPRGITGGYRNEYDCARGLVSRRCGGQPTE